MIAINIQLCKQISIRDRSTNWGHTRCNAGQGSMENHHSFKTPLNLSKYVSRRARASWHTHRWRRQVNDDKNHVSWPWDMEFANVNHTSWDINSFRQYLFLWRYLKIGWGYQQGRSYLPEYIVRSLYRTGRESIGVALFGIGESKERLLNQWFYSNKHHASCPSFSSKSEIDFSLQWNRAM